MTSRVSTRAAKRIAASTSTRSWSLTKTTTAAIRMAYLRSYGMTVPRRLARTTNTASVSTVSGMTKTNMTMLNVESASC